MKLSSKKIRVLAAEFNKDPRTIRRWIKDKNRLLVEHPVYQKIIIEK